MFASVIQISVKPDTPGEVGLPKMSVGKALVKKEGLEGDYNRARKKKKDNDPDMAVMVISTDILDQLNQEGVNVDTISEGGAAMMAYAFLQFTDLDEQGKKAIEKALYKYCELDTMAMVMIMEAFVDWAGVKLKEE